MSAPIDDAIETVLSDLGPDWYVDTIVAVHRKVNATTFAMSLPLYLDTKYYEASIKHPNGLTATGEGMTIGSALASAALNVLKQEERRQEAVGQG